MNEGLYENLPEVYSGPFCYSAKNRNPYRVEGKGLGCITNAGYKNYGWTNYDYGLIYSSNTITASLETKIITPDIYLDYLGKFGFFNPVNTDGMREETGVLNFTWPSDKLALSYGQGSTVTMLQMLQAYSAIFSDGTMVKPYFVDSIRDPLNNDVIYKAETTVVGNPISADTAKRLQELLSRVVNDDDGTAKYYRIPETTIIGKTGTTQLAVSGSYKSGKTIVSLMSAMPKDDPKYMIYYCFEADYNKNAHYHTEAISSFLRKVAMRFNITDNITNNVEQTEEVVSEKKEINTYDMVNLTNHSLDYAKNKLNELGVDIIVLGDGDRVIDQYPNENSVVSTNQKVFLLTSSSGFLMPNMTGWTRKDVVGFWDVSDVGLKITGFGKVVAQSVIENTYISKGTEIEVVLE